MIIFDRFLCCISLKTFGKFFGWAGTVICVFLAYAVFLVLSGRKTTGDKKDGNSLFAYPQFIEISVLFIALLLVAAIFHVLLLFGIKFVSYQRSSPTKFLIIFLAAQVLTNRAISHSINCQNRCRSLHLAFPN